MKAKYAGTCYGCGEDIEPGQEIKAFGNGEAYHQGCEPENHVPSHVSQDLASYDPQKALMDSMIYGITAVRLPETK